MESRLSLLFLLLVLGAQQVSCSVQYFDWGSLHCPRDPNGTLPTPTYGFRQRAWMMCTELLIDAPPKFIYDVLLDFNAYSSWNTFVVDVFNMPENVTNTPEDVYVGMPMDFTVVGILPGVNGTSNEVVTVLDDNSDKGPHGYLLNAWRSDVYFDGVLSKAEHPNILTPAGRRSTRYVSYETYYEGSPSEFILQYKDILQVLFDQQGRDLKEFVESRYKAPRA